MGPALADRVLLIAVYYRTNLMLRQVALLFGVSKSAAHRIVDHLAPLLALADRSAARPGPDTVLIADGTLVPTHASSAPDLVGSGLGAYSVRLPRAGYGREMGCLRGG